MFTFPTSFAGFRLPVRRKKRQSRVARGVRARRAFFEPLETRHLLATITVTSLADNLTVNGQVTLREAIQAANTNASVDGSTAGSGADVIVFAAGLTGRISITSQLPTIIGDLSITGPGAKLLTIDTGGGASSAANDGWRIFEVNDGNTANQIEVAISGMKLTGGDTGTGGAIISVENLTLSRVAIVRNAAIFGGGIANSGNLTVTASTLSGNTAVRGGGAINSSGTASIIDSTISGNSSPDLGGGIVNYGPSGKTATLTVTRSTVTSNTAGIRGGGIDSFAAGGSVVVLNNSIVAGNTAPANRDFGSTGSTSGAFNLIGVAGTGQGGVTDGTNGNQVGTVALPIDPLLGPLADNGGPTMTHALLLDSPAIDAGDPTNVAVTDTYSAAVLADNPSTYFKFDETIGTTVADSSGHSRAGTYHGSPNLTTPGIGSDSATGFGLDGVDDRVRATGIPITASFTAEVWARSTTPVWNDFSWVASSRSDNGFMISPITTGGTRDWIGFLTDSGGNQRTIGTHRPNDITGWHQYAISYDGTTARMYFDGQLVIENSTLSIARTAGDITLDLGFDDCCGGQRFGEGALDEFALYDTALSPGDIARHYSAAAPLDQRGEPFARVVGAAIDIGAYERQTLDASFFVVTTAADELDYSNADVSLREAINSANGSVGDNTITFAPALSGGTLLLGGTELEITETLTIDASFLGAGVTIDAQQNSRVLDFTASSGDLTLRSLTLTGGKTTGDNKIISEPLSIETIHSGGGIRFLSAGILTLTSSTLSGNSTAGFGASGGGIFASSGAVTLTSSTLSGNSTAGERAQGGGIYTNSGALTLTSSTLSGNRTAGANADGGGIYASFGAVTLTNSTISGNSTTGDDADGGGIFALTGALTLTSSTISGNSTAGDSARGGGIRASSGAVTLTNSTISGNSTTGDDADGGGVFVRNFSDDPTFSITNSIVAGNTVSAASVSPDLVPDPDSTLTVEFSLIGDVSGSRIDANTGTGNLLGVDWKTVLENDGTDPILKNNGGPTETIALLADSPAIDRGANDLAKGSGPDGLPGTSDDIPLTTDQRGVARILDGDADGTATIDIGAYEAPTKSLGTINLPTGETLVTNENGKIFVRNSGIVLFTDDRTNVSKLTFLGGAHDASLAVGDLKLLNSMAVDLAFDGQGGADQFRLLEAGQTLDLTSLPDNKMQGIETIDITGTGDNTLTLNLNEVVNLSPTTDTLRAKHDAGDVVNYGLGWTVSLPQIIAGQFVHVLKQAGATIAVANTLPFQNPLRPLDTNHDGAVAPIDVLIIINRLNASGSSSLQTPTSVAGLTEYFYLDTNGDGSVAPVDVIQVINFLNNPAGQPEGEGHLGTGLLGATVQVPVSPSARVAARDSRPDETTRLRNAELHFVVAEHDSVRSVGTERPARVIEAESLSDSIDAFFASFLRTDRIQ